MLLNYFAYGSNMSLARLSKRVPSAVSLGMGMLEQHQLCFHKVSKDGSAKCDAFLTNDSEHRVFGMLYTIEADHKLLLDEFEGVGEGYNDKTVTIIDHGGNRIAAFTYYATHIESGLLPYSWYLNHVLIGAREAALPEQYLNKLASIPTLEDHDQERSRLEWSVHLRD